MISKENYYQLGLHHWTYYSFSYRLPTQTISVFKVEFIGNPRRWCIGMTDEHDAIYTLGYFKTEAEARHVATILSLFK